MAEVVALLLPMIGEYLVAPVKRQFGYLVFYDRNINNLETEVQNLEDTRDRILRRVDAGQRNNETVENDVERWLVEVDKLSEEANRFLEDDVKANKGCLNGRCPNLKSRYSLSRKAKMITQDLVELCGRRYRFETVTYHTPLEEIVFKPNRDYGGDFASRNSIVNDVMKALTSYDINIIGICGMRGVGKTTLVNKVAEIIKKEKLFDEVVMVTVSQNPNLIKIQSDIAEMLGFTLVGGNNLRVRAENLRARMLKSKRILVILDDVWSRLELNNIGISFGDDQKDCKIVLTSRSYDVCRNHMDAAQIFQLDVLSKEEAWDLFKEEAGISNDSTGHNIDFPYKEVANECACRPIAIVNVARALKGKPKLSWDLALQQLRNPIAKNITEAENDVFEVLKWSYIYFESEEATEFFLLCSLFPKDSNIPIDALATYGIGLKLFERVDTVEFARMRVHALVDYLKAHNLLMHGESNDEDCVKIHGVMRDVAISIAAREEHSFKVSCDKPLKDWPEDARQQNYAVISLSLTGMHKLPGDIEFPKLQLLQLLCQGEELDTPDSFFEGMKELKVATFSNMSFRQLPKSLRFLSSLKTLSLSVCEWIDDISVIGELKNLEILRFVNSKIRELPKEIGSLSYLKLLELANCVVGRIFPGVLSRLEKLEELYIGDSFDKWHVVEQGKEGTNASIDELASLSNLVALKICVQLNHVKFWRKNLNLEKVERFHIIIGKPYPRKGYIKMSSSTHLPYVDFSLPSTHLRYDFSHFQNQLKFRYVDMSLLTKTVLKNLLKKTRFLKLKSVKGSMKIFSGLSKNDFAVFKKLKISDCGDFEYLINTAELKKDSFTAVYGLEELTLKRLPALTHVWKGPTQRVCFRNLINVYVVDCKKLKSVFSIHIEESDEVNEGREHEIGPPDKIVFPKVNELHLETLPSFTALCEDTIAIEMPGLKTLYLEEIPKLQYLCPPEIAKLQYLFKKKKSLFRNEVTLTNIENLSFYAMENLVEIWPEKLQAKLRRLVVIDCNKLSNILFSPNLIECMQNLEILDVRRCQSVEVGFNLERLDVGEGHPAIALPCLKELNFDYLPKLTHVWATNSAHSQGFQNLIIIRVQMCDSLRNLFLYSAAKHLVNLQKLEITKCEAIEAIIAHEQEVDEVVTTNTIIFPQLTVLTLKYLPNLTSFFRQDYTFEGSFLKRVEVIRCPKMKELSLKHCNDLEDLYLEYLHAWTHLWKHPSQILWLCNLRNVDVRECEKLESVFSLSKENPRKTEVIVSSEGEHEIVATDKIVLPKLNKLRLRGLPSFISFYDALIAIELPELKELHLEKIPKLQYLCRVSKGNCYGVIQSLFHNQVSLTSIEGLTVCDMDNLIEIWPEELQAKLKSLLISKCRKLPNILFSSNLIECMQNLEDIDVTSCQSVEVAFDLGGLDVGEGHPAIALSCLKTLKLKSLPKLANVWINNSPCSQGFQNLGSLSVEKCDSLRNLFSPSIFKLLVKLRSLKITKCKVMETIIAHEEVITNTIVFSQLTHLKLMDLPNLTSFCKKDYTIEGSSLIRVEVIRCPKMEALPSALQQLREQYDMQFGIAYD